MNRPENASRQGHLVPFPGDYEAFSLDSGSFPRENGGEETGNVLYKGQPVSFPRARETLPMGNGMN
jgi:hypothetical protein